jgi:hypothetical protein
MISRRGRATLVVLWVALLYGGTLRNGFVWDDQLLALSPPALSTVLTQRTGAYYRPLVMLSFHADRALWGDRAAGHHLTNLAAHAATSVLVGELATAVGLAPGPALIAALAFAAHPAQTDAVSYVSGRTDILCALFMLIALLLWRRARRPFDGAAFASALTFAAALLCKEVAAPLAFVWGLPGAHPARDAPRPLLVLGVAATWAIGYVATGRVPAMASTLGERTPGIVMTAASYLQLLVWPVGLHVERFVAAGGWSAATLVATTLLLAAVGVLLAAAARRTVGGWLLLGVVLATYAPASGLIPIYPAIARHWLFAPEHFLYLPLVGLMPLLVGTAASSLPPAARRSAVGLAVIVLCTWAVLVVERNRAWRDEETLFRNAVAYDPPTSRVWFNLGNLELARGRLDEAARLYGQALARAPHDAAVHLNLGIVRQRQGRSAGAEHHYRLAIQIEPRHRDAARALAALLARRGAYDEAATVLAGAGLDPSPRNP